VVALAPYPRGAGARLSGVLFSYDGRPAGTPSPDPLRLMKAPSRATLSPKGGGALSMVRWDRTLPEGGHGAAEPRFKIPDSRRPNSCQGDHRGRRVPRGRAAIQDSKFKIPDSRRPNTREGSQRGRGHGAAERLFKIPDSRRPKWGNVSLPTASLRNSCGVQKRSVPCRFLAPVSSRRYG
jgi:hypothetical protein